MLEKGPSIRAIFVFPLLIRSRSTGISKAFETSRRARGWALYRSLVSRFYQVWQVAHKWSLPCGARGSPESTAEWQGPSAVQSGSQRLS